MLNFLKTKRGGTPGNPGANKVFNAVFDASFLPFLAFSTEHCKNNLMRAEGIYWLLLCACPEKVRAINEPVPDPTNARAVEEDRKKFDPHRIFQ
jgi:hypothetical protein